MTAKGYVVRGKDARGNDVEAMALRLTPAVTAFELLTRGEATAVRIFAISPDGTETALPTYEEAIAALAEVRHEVEQAIAYRDGGQRVAKPPALSGCTLGALHEIRRMIPPSSGG